jgi:hypothetical protein
VLNLVYESAGKSMTYANKAALAVVTTWDLTLAYGESCQRTATQPAGGKLAATLTAPDRVLSVTS